MSKNGSQNIWNGNDFELKMLSIKKRTTHNYWSVINTKRSTNTSNFIVAFSRDYTQFPDQVKNWYLLCNQSDCFSGGTIFGANVTYREAHENLPKCGNITNTMTTTDTATDTTRVVSASIIIAVILRV